MLSKMYSTSSGWVLRFGCFFRSSPVEKIKGQTLLPWELPSQCGCLIICKPGLNQGATFGANEQKGKQEAKTEAEHSHYHTYQDSSEALPLYCGTAEGVKLPAQAPAFPLRNSPFWRKLCKLNHYFTQLGTYIKSYKLHLVGDKLCIK